MALAPQVKEDVWIPTSCNMCFNNCSIKVHRVDGIVVKIEGNTDTSAFGGKVCSKAASGIMQLYDPSRRTKPMRRTNPQKGIGIDPGWQEISWDEAYSIMAEQIQKALKKRGPDNLCQSAFITNVPGSLSSGTFFGGTLGARNYIIPDICGAAIHGVTEVLTSGCNAGPDYAYTKYVLQFGSQAGIATRHGFNMTVKRFADARMNGARYVNVDPRMSAGAEKADRWVPIRPGTDAAMALAIAYVLIHELRIYDREYLKTYTNAASLVDVETGRIVRQENTNKPYVWDLRSNSATVFDDPSIGELALDGSYQLAGKTCKTGFQMYADHVKTYTPESVEQITTVPAVTIRQVAKEFGEAACIGSTIELEGKSYPYRPACADSFSGISRHKHGFLTHWAIYWLNVLVGSANVPGGLIAFAAMNHGYPETGQPNWRPGVWEEENLVEPMMDLCSRLPRESPLGIRLCCPFSIAPAAQRPKPALH